MEIKLIQNKKEENFCLQQARIVGIIFFLPGKDHKELDSYCSNSWQICIPCTLNPQITSWINSLQCCKLLGDPGSEARPCFVNKLLQHY